MSSSSFIHPYVYSVVRWDPGILPSLLHLLFFRSTGQRGNSVILPPLAFCTAFFSLMCFFLPFTYTSVRLLVLRDQGIMPSVMTLSSCSTGTGNGETSARVLKHWLCFFSIPPVFLFVWSVLASISPSVVTLKTFDRPEPAQQLQPNLAYIPPRHFFLRVFALLRLSAVHLLRVSRNEDIRRSSHPGAYPSGMNPA
jgi:hypothetical protein